MASTRQTELNMLDGPVLPPQPGQLVPLGRSQARGRLIPPALLPVSRSDPRADRLRGRLELSGKILGRPSGTDQINHLTAELRRIRRMRLGHQEHLWRKLQGVHQTGSIPVVRAERSCQ